MKFPGDLAVELGCRGSKSPRFRGSANPNRLSLLGNRFSNDRYDPRVQRVQLDFSLKELPDNLHQREPEENLNSGTLSPSCVPVARDVVSTNNDRRHLVTSLRVGWPGHGTRVFLSRQHKL